MIALLTACLFFEILVHVLNIASAKACAKTVFGHLKAKKGREGALPQFLELVLSLVCFLLLVLNYQEPASLEHASRSIVASATYLWYVITLDILRFGSVPLWRIENA